MIGNRCVHDKPLSKLISHFVQQKTIYCDCMFFGIARHGTRRAKGGKLDLQALLQLLALALARRQLALAPRELLALAGQAGGGLLCGRRGSAGGSEPRRHTTVDLEGPKAPLPCLRFSVKENSALQQKSSRACTSKPISLALCAAAMHN